MNADSSDGFNWIEFESSVFRHLHALKLMKKSVADYESGKGMIPAPDGVEGWGSWLYRNVAMFPLASLAHHGTSKYLNQGENLKRQTDAEKLLAEDANRERFCHYLSELSREGMMQEEYEIKVIKAVVFVLYTEKPGHISTAGIDAQTIARLVWEFSNKKDYCAD
jgi:hypothetical protein